MKKETGNYHHPALKEKLLELARTELAEKGVRGFSLRSIAARAGVSRGAPYRHFEGRDGLTAELMRIGFRELTAALKAADEAAPGSSADKLMAQGRAYLEFGGRCPELLELIFSEPGLRSIAAAPGEVCEKQHEEYDAFAVLLRRVEACLSEGSLDPSAGAFETATVFWASVHGLSVLGREGVLAGMASHCGRPARRGEESGLMEAFRRVFLRQ
jgi:AcrR family transcriptional regulator